MEILLVLVVAFALLAILKGLAMLALFALAIPGAGAVAAAIVTGLCAWMLLIRFGVSKRSIERSTMQLRKDMGYS